MRIQPKIQLTDYLAVSISARLISSTHREHAVAESTLVVKIPNLPKSRKKAKLSVPSPLT